MHDGNISKSKSLLWLVYWTTLGRGKPSNLEKELIVGLYRFCWKYLQGHNDEGARLV